MTGRFSRHELPLGTVLGDAYRLVRRIAEGGMGTVYEAEQLRLGKRCAVKVMAPELALSRDALARFHREVEVTSQLNHPHIVQVMDFGSAPGGEPFLVMEYLDGEDLAERLRRTGRLTPAAAGHVLKQVSSALAATHAGGIVHRDLKPANIFLITIAGGGEADSDFVKVVDFGISKVKHAGPRLTRASVLMGTPQYMPPEQASGRIDAIDHRSDQWSLACIAWEMLAGRGPFWGKDVTALLFQIVHEDPLPEAARAAGLTPAVEEVLRRALSKRPRDRFPNITAFSRAFEAALTAPAVARSEVTRTMSGKTDPGRRSDATPPADRRGKTPTGDLVASAADQRGSSSPWRLGTIFAPRAHAVPGGLTAAAGTLFRSLRTRMAPAPRPSPMRTLLGAVTPVRLMAGISRLRRRRRPRHRRLWIALAALPVVAGILLHGGSWWPDAPARPVDVARESKASLPGAVVAPVSPPAPVLETPPRAAASAPAAPARAPSRARRSRPAHADGAAPGQRVPTRPATP